MCMLSSESELRITEKSKNSSVADSSHSGPKRPLEVHGIVFDTGDILYDATVWWRWLVQLLGRMGIHSFFPAIYLVWRREYLRDVNSGKRDYWDAFREFLRAIGLSSGQVDEIIVAAKPRHSHSVAEVRSMPGVSFTLAQLSRIGIPLGILSNAPYDTDLVRRKLRALNLERYFSAILSSVDLKFSADDPRAYTMAAEAIDVPAHQTAFIGHATEELAGAATAGLLTVAFNQDFDAEADISLERFEQLIDSLPLSIPARKAG